MAVKNIRQFIEALDKTGDVVHVREEVDWEYEAGAIGRRTILLGGPAALFENIRDYPPGFRLFASPIFNIRRIAVAFGLSPETPLEEINRVYQEAYHQAIKPVLVRDGPCKENIMTGNNVDLFQFPVPLIHRDDGGRYLGTCHLVINKDPDSEWTNWGMYRVMVHDRSHTGLFLHHRNDAGTIWETKYLPRKLPMPVAIVIGPSPLSVLAATLFFPYGISEVEKVGALQQEPVELVKCETSDLLVPAGSEIVIEGEVIPDFLLAEGPFVEFTNYQTGVELRPVVWVKAITYRNNPILTMLGASSFLAFAEGIGMKEHLLSHGIPVTDVYVPRELYRLGVIVGVKSHHSPTIVTQIKNALCSNKLSQTMIFVVDEDVNVYDLGQVLHAFSAKFNPSRSVRVFENEHISPLAPAFTEKERIAAKGSKVVFDCTWPSDWPAEDIPSRAFYHESYTKEVREKVEGKWEKYGFRPAKPV